MTHAAAELCAEDVQHFLDNLDDCQRNEAVGRFLKIEGKELWAELLRSFASRRGAARRVAFRALTGEAVELILQPKQTLFSAKQALLKQVAQQMPAVDPGHRRDAQVFAGGDLLADHTLAAMLPDEVSVVFKQVKRIAPPSDSELSEPDDL
ncbi:unnamed protein product [Symbiodinium natans]|uniref:Ubiquitin-like domain-containing protein n=1 Tax=Symbiodinium natans TaxID=878477 RepID=A0A812HHI2_9DINO|nr:unnamed protein product [Symbiodinium natans]